MDLVYNRTHGPQQRLKFLLSSPQQLKVFKTLLQVLMKVGASNLFLVADENQICLSSCNSSRSCYVSTDLPRSFFSTYEFQCNLPKLKVSLPLKNLQIILRTSKVRTMTFSLVPEIHFLFATLECEWGMMKEYRIAFSEDQAIFRPAASGGRETSAIWFDTNNASSFSKVLSTIHVNSAADLVAVAYDAGNESIKLFTDCQGAQTRPDVEVQMDALHTTLEMHDSTCHFGTIRNLLGMSTKVSFNLKDFLLMVHTAEGLSCDLSLCFSVPGQPIVAICTPAQDCRLEMILVTLDEAGRLPSNIMSAASLAPRQSLDGSFGPPISGHFESRLHGHTNPFDMLGARMNDDAYDECASKLGTLGDDSDVIASTPPQSPGRCEGEPAHTPGVIM